MSETPIDKMLKQKYPDVTSPNEMRLEYLGINGLCTFPFADSSARAVMFGTQVSQRIVTEHCDRKLQVTGLERRMADSSAKITMPHDGHILAIIPRFRQAPVAGNIDFNPKTIVFYEKNDTGEIDYFELAHYGSFDQQFGFKYHPVDQNHNMLRNGAFIPKDTVFSEPPSTRDGFFDFGFNANVVFTSLPAVAEDGFVVAEEFLEKLKFNMYEKRAVNFGRTTYPIKIKGDKIHPDIGEYVDEDGLLMTLRDHDVDTLPVDMSASALGHIDHYCDESVYARAGYRGKIIDIEVFRNYQIDSAPEQLCEQTMKYYKANLTFHREIVDLYQRLRAEKRRKFGPFAKVQLTPKCQALVTFSVAITEQENADSGKVQLIHRKEEIDQWRVVFTIEYEMTPGINYKFSDSHGGKGVVVKKMPRAMMPKDKDGNIADIAICGSSRFSRMIPGSLYELFLSGAQRDVVRHHLKPILGWVDGMSEDRFVYGVSEDNINKAYEEYLEFLYLTTHTQYNIEKQADLQTRKEILYDICKAGTIYLNMPIGDEIDLSKSVMKIKERFKITMGYFSMVDDTTGKIIEVRDKSTQIAPMYMMLLDKIGDEWMAVSTANMHLFGTLSPINRSARHSYPWRVTPPKFMGETEGRLLAANCGPLAVAELQSRANSVQTQKSAVWNILNSDKPTELVQLVDRSRIPFGDTKPLQLTRHMFNCLGVDLKWEPGTGPINPSNQ